MSQEELKRMFRHGVTPAVIALVNADYLPEYARGDLTELAIIGLTFIAVYFLSWNKSRNV